MYGFFPKTKQQTQRFGGNLKDFFFFAIFFSLMSVSLYLHLQINFSKRPIAAAAAQIDPAKAKASPLSLITMAEVIRTNYNI